MNNLTSQADKGRRFSELHRRSGAFVIPNPWDAGSARLLALLGYALTAASVSILVLAGSLLTKGFHSLLGLFSGG